MDTVDVELGGITTVGFEGVALTDGEILAEGRDTTGLFYVLCAFPGIVIGEDGVLWQVAFCGGDKESSKEPGKQAGTDKCQKFLLVESVPHSLIPLISSNWFTSSPFTLASFGIRFFLFEFDDSLCR